MTGYLIITAYVFMLAIIWIVLRKRGFRKEQSVRSFIFAGGKIPVWLLSASIFSAWLWVTTIIGSAEAYTLYGVTGAIGYVIGASISFVCFIPVVTGVLKIMPKASSYLEFTGKRFGENSKRTFYIFAILISAYVLIEQAVGLAWVLERIYGTSFKHAAFFVVVIAAVFVALAGMRGVLVAEFTVACIVVVSFVILIKIFASDSRVVSVLEPFFRSGGSGSGISFSAMMGDSVFIAGIRYSVGAIIIAFSQLLFDPAYYLKATMAKRSKDIWIAFVTGGIILWVPIGLASALVIGMLSQGLNEEVTDLFHGSSALIFSIFIVCIGMTAISHYLMGMLGIFTADYYGASLKSGATDSEKIKFGRVMTLLFGVFCALIAISLENISLLTIDMFCSVFFAAPCAPLLMGLVSKKKLGNTPVAATVIGLACGFSVWTFVVSDDRWSWIWGTVTSFTVPLIVMAIAAAVSKENCY